MELKQLLINIPNGKKNDYLGSLFINGIAEYYENVLDIDLEIDDILVDNAHLLFSTKNNFFKDIDLFSRENFQIILNELNVPVKDNTSIKLTEKYLREYFNIYDEELVEEKLLLSSNSDCQYKLHDFQNRIRRKVINQFFRGEKRFLIHMPTGSGKTRTAAEIVLDFIRLSSSTTLLNENMKIIWVAQQEER